MAQKFNWGAALMSAGQSFDEYAERKRREMMAKALREQQQADLAEQRAYDDQRWLERLNITDPLMPVPGDVREYVGLPESSSFAVPVPGAAFGAPLGGPPVPTMARTSAVKNWQSMIPEPPKPATYDYYMQTPDGGYAGFSGNPWTAAGEGRRVNITGTYQGQPVAALENWSAPKTTSETEGGYYVTDGTGEPVFYPQSPSMLDGMLTPAGSHNGRPLLRYSPGTPSSNAPKDPKDVVAEWYGGERQAGDYDPKTGVATPYSYPFRGSVFDPVASPIDVIPDLTNAVRNEQAQGRGIATEQDARRVLGNVLSNYDVDLARQMDIDLGASFRGWEPDTEGGRAIPGQYKKPRLGWLPDDIRSAAEFYADIVNKQLADGADEVEMRTISAWLKKKGLTLDQLSQYLKTSKDMGVNLPAAGAEIVRQRAAAADTSLSKY